MLPGVSLPGPATDDWPDPADLCRGLLAALAKGQPDAASDWAGELLVAVDRALGEQVATLLADPAVSRIQAAWFGLASVLREPASDRLIEVHVADAADDELTPAWLDDLLYAGPMDTRGGRPIGLLVTGLDPAAAHAVAAVAERALCPILAPSDPHGPEPIPAGRFLTWTRSRGVLCPPLAADEDWRGWFGWPSDAAHQPLFGSAAHAMAAAVVQSVLATGWPVDATDAAPDLPRLLMACRFAQRVAVRCRDLADGSPADVAADVGELLRGRYVGPRLPLRQVDVTTQRTPAGGLTVTLTLAPRLHGDDPGEQTVQLTLSVGGDQ